MPAVLAGADIGVAPFDIGGARAAVARVLLVAAEDLRIHGRRLPVVAPAVDRIPSLVADGRRACLYDSA
jgi:hypothetical protein